MTEQNKTARCDGGDMELLAQEVARLERENTHLRGQVQELVKRCRELADAELKEETGRNQTSWVRRDWHQLKSGEYQAPAHIRQTRWKKGG